MGGNLNWLARDCAIIAVKYMSMIASVPDPVGSEPFWSDPDLDVRDRIRIWILILINDPILIFLVCVKAINTVHQESLLLNFLVLKILFRAYFHHTKFPEKS
jgi:hypothetical protein